MTECETTLSRTRVLEMNEWLDAIEEAEFVAKEKAEKAKPRT